MGSVEVPKKHKACVYDNPGSISTKIEEIDTPEPGYGEVLINLYAFDLSFRVQFQVVGAYDPDEADNYLRLKLGRSYHYADSN
jgi:hypothetical protein